MISTSLSANGVMFSMRFIIASVLAGVLFLGAAMVKQAIRSADAISDNMARRTEMVNRAVNNPESCDMSSPLATARRDDDNRPSKIVIIRYK